MNRRYLVPVVAAALLLTGCASPAPASEANNASSSSSAPEATPTPEAVVPLDLSGEWKQTNSKSATSYQTATVTADIITIFWVNEEDSMTATYWVGTFPAPTEDTDTYSFTSQGDVEAMSNQLLASQSETKDFAYLDGKLTYELQALGTTMTVEMTRQ